MLTRRSRIYRDLVEAIEVITSPLGEELLHRRPSTLASRVYFIVKAILSKLTLAHDSALTSNTKSTARHKWFEDLVRRISSLFYCHNLNQG